MKLCANCSSEDVGGDGETLCRVCDAAETAAERKRQRARMNRRAREQALRDCGLVKVRSALGGVYWE